MGRELFKNKYRIDSIRLAGWDYTSDSYYFVTICTGKRVCWFGEIKNNKMFLSDIGKMVLNYWLEIPKHFPFIGLDEYILMPNHLHGIIQINKESLGRDEAMPRLYTPSMNSRRNSLSSIIGSFKSICSKEIHKLGDKDFFWQERFYDHVIRDNVGLETIRQYIWANLENWDKDKDNPEFSKLKNDQ